MITYFGALNLPITARARDMAQQRANTYKLSPQDETEGAVSQRTRGMYQT